MSIECEHQGGSWLECDICVRTSQMSFKVKGGTPKFFLTNDDLPPSEEVDAAKRELHGDPVGRYDSD